MKKLLKKIIFGNPTTGYTSKPQGISHIIIPEEYLKHFPVNDLKPTT
jgi:hypothetical protein